MKGIFLGLLLIAFGLGGINGFARVFSGLVSLALIVVVVGALIAFLVFIGIRWYRAAHSPSSVGASPGWRGMPRLQPESSELSQPLAQEIAFPSSLERWTVSSVRTALDEIDWYQFEKFCAALLWADGFTVERKGGAQPDGGVDLLVAKSGDSALIQCKHWRTWVVQEKVVREMLGSMTHFKVSAGSIYTLKGWTKPAASFAAHHRITLFDGDALSQQAVIRLRPGALDEILRPRDHRCPKCESVMILRTGNFTSFWGCSQYPRCRGKLNPTGAR